jgi:hypothetical protein
MLRHIILLKFRPSASLEQLENAIAALHRLGSATSDIREWSVGRSIRRTRADNVYDVAEVAAFDDDAALLRFKNHPEHIKTREFLGTIADWVVVDYEE